METLLSQFPASSFTLLAMVLALPAIGAFVNGIPVATAELKSHYTQGVQDAIYQYQTDREPLFKPRNAPEPLLSFPGGALVHFAVSNAEAAMTTRLAGLDTRFLPFNQGHAGGAGNPPKEGIATDYLWKEVWQRDSFLQILGRYQKKKKNDKNQLAGWIFPRYHQLKATRRLVAAVLHDGPGHKYLVQHSAGSGKTSTMALVPPARVAVTIPAAPNSASTFMIHPPT